MAFDREINVTKIDIGDVETVLFSPSLDNTENPQSATVNAQVILSNGDVQQRSFDLLARLGDDAEGLTHRTALVAYRDYVRARLVAEVLP